MTRYNISCKSIKTKRLTHGKEKNHELRETSCGGRSGAYLYEALNPYAGNTLYMAEQEIDMRVSLPAVCLYAAKGILWIAAVCFLGRKEKK